jgi:hypothetical protein
MYILESVYLDDEKTTFISLRRLSDMASIPLDESNTDYQAFLKYQAEGGVVLPADNNEQTS